VDIRRVPNGVPRRVIDEERDVAHVLLQDHVHASAGFVGIPPHVGDFTGIRARPGASGEQCQHCPERGMDRALHSFCLNWCHANGRQLSATVAPGARSPRALPFSRMRLSKSLPANRQPGVPPNRSQR